MARVLSFLIRYFSNYYTLHRSDLAARAAPLDPRLLNKKLNIFDQKNQKKPIYSFRIAVNIKLYKSLQNDTVESL